MIALAAARSKLSGFTLAETVIAAGVSAMVLAGVSGGAIALRRTYESANYHMNAQTEQLRVFDYVGKEVRAASIASVLDGGRRLDLTVPASSSGSLAMHLNLPVLGALRNNSASATRSITYVLEGDRLLRTENGRTKEVARTVTDFQVSKAGTSVEVTAIFSPRFSRSPLTAAQEATRLRSTFLLRNAPGG